MKNGISEKAFLLFLVVGLFSLFGTQSYISAASRSTEFCAQNSPDGTLTLRISPSPSARVILTLRNGDCGVWIRPDAPRSRVDVQAVISGRTGWVKSKWIVRADKVGLPAPVTTKLVARVPATTKRTTPVRVPGSLSTPHVVESSIDGDFEGWEGETIFKLMNGQIWQQASYDYNYTYSYNPDVVIYRSGSVYKMKVDGVDDTIEVVRLK